MKKIYHVIADSNAKTPTMDAKVYRDTEWDEYVVRYYVEHKLTGTSHHDDRDDAINTANYEVERHEAKYRAKRAGGKKSGQVVTLIKS